MGSGCSPAKKKSFNSWKWNAQNEAKHQKAARALTNQPVRVYHIREILNIYGKLRKVCQSPVTDRVERDFLVDWFFFFLYFYYLILPTRSIVNNLFLLSLLLFFRSAHFTVLFVPKKFARFLRARERHTCLSSILLIFMFYFSLVFEIERYSILCLKTSLPFYQAWAFACRHTHTSAFGYDLVCKW